MNILHAIILGAIQGASEFLPISSSGHLVVFPYIFNWNYQGLEFDIALHMGTVLAIIVYFWSDWMLIITGAIASSSGGKASPGDPLKVDSRLRGNDINNYPPNLFWIILVASIPAAIAGYFLESLAENALRNPLLVAINLIFFGALLWLADTASKNKKKLADMNYSRGFLIGIAQAVSLFPGVSRSGITASAGLLLNMDRKSAMRFSFLLATPAMIGAFLLTLNKFQASMINASFILAIITSAVVGFLSIKYLLRYLEKHSFLPFVIYRFALGIVIIILYFAR